MKVYLVIGAWDEEVHLYGIFSNIYTAQALRDQKPAEARALVVSLNSDVPLGDMGVAAMKLNGSWIITTPENIQIPRTPNPK